MKGLLGGRRITRKPEAVDMMQVDYVSLFIGLIFDRYCGEEDTAPSLKTFTTYADLLLVPRKMRDVCVFFGNPKTA